MEISTILRQNNLKVTPKRKVIFEELHLCEQALSPRELYEKLLDRGQQVDLVSVYRNLDKFAQIGLVHKFQDGRCVVSSLASKNSNSLRVLVKCFLCGQSHETLASPTEDKSLEMVLQSYSQPVKELRSVVLEGRCEKC